MAHIPPQPEAIRDVDLPNVAGEDLTWTDCFEEDWVLFPDLPEPLREVEDPSEVSISQSDTLDALSEYADPREALRRVEQYVQMNSMQRQLEAGGGKVKRSPNAFILYRIAFHHLAEQVYRTKDQRFVSEICGESWSREPERIRKWFDEEAKVRAAARELMMSDAPHGERSAMEVDRQRPVALLQR